LLQVILLSSPQVTLSRVMVRRIVGIAIALPLVALAASPIVALVIHQRGVENYGNHYSLLARAAEQAWRAATDKPLRIIGSYDTVLYGSSFYFHEPPRTFEIVTPRVTPWTSEADVAREGIAMMCPLDHAVCMTALNARAARTPNARRSEVTLARSFLGIPGAPHRYAIAVIPPQP
jgi:hypothetical protein